MLGSDKRCRKSGDEKRELAEPWRGAAVLDGVLGLLSTEKTVCEQRHSNGKGGSSAAVSGKNIPGRGGGQCKGCPAGARLLSSRETQKVSRGGQSKGGGD